MKSICLLLVSVWQMPQISYSIIERRQEARQYEKQLEAEAYEPMKNPLKEMDFTSVDLRAQLFFQEFRSFDGSGNNLENDDFGEAFTDVVRCLEPDYSDGFNSLAGETRENARELSNVLAMQIPEESPIFVGGRFLTQHVWQWGQITDHDLTLIVEDVNDDSKENDIDIYVPCCDPNFDMECSCAAEFLFEVFRTEAAEGTGTGPGNPRRQVNEITGWVDSSVVYGSDKERADALRTFENGQLLTSPFTNLPFNEVGFAPNDPDSTDPSFFLSGEERTNEQVGLSVYHTLFKRVHAEISLGVIDNVNKFQPNLTPEEFDEEVYQLTKLIINAIQQKITYKEWLPSMFPKSAFAIDLPPYTGYMPTAMNPSACTIFSSAAFRFGHTMLPQKLPLRNSDCTHIGNFYGECPDCNSDLPLAEAFFSPGLIDPEGVFIDSLINGYTCTLANEVDTRVTNAVRDFLFANNDLFGILDLIAINIQRGREHGLPDYNTVRESLGLVRLTEFTEITSDLELAEDLKIIYRHDIDEIDLFFGGLAEDHLEGGSFGETFTRIILQQFRRLRDGDRFWFQNYIKKGPLLDFINGFTFSDFLQISTGVNFNRRRNVFINRRAVSIFDKVTPQKYPNGYVTPDDGYVSPDDGYTIKNDVYSPYGSGQTGYVPPSGGYTAPEYSAQPPVYSAPQQPYVDPHAYPDTPYVPSYV